MSKDNSIPEDEFGPIIPTPNLVNVYPSADIGTNAKIGAFCEIGPNVKIGVNCNIGAFCFIPEGVIIGDNVFVGPRVTFLNDKYPPSKGAWRNHAPTIVGSCTSIGGGAVILPHIIIGPHAVIGAGSVVTRSVEAFETVKGNPATIHHYGEALQYDRGG